MIGTNYQTNKTIKIMYTKSEIREELDYLNLTSDEITMIKNITEEKNFSILEASQMVLN